MEQVQCPRCKKRVAYKSVDDLPHFPFCSERCKMADLGMWFREEHRIPETMGKPEDGAEPPQAKDSSGRKRES